MAYLSREAKKLAVMELRARAYMSIVDLCETPNCSPREFMDNLIDIITDCEAEEQEIKDIK